MSNRFGVIFLLFAIATRAFGDVTIAKMDKNLADIILMANMDIESNPQRSSQCFSIYNPKLKQLTDEYEQAHEQCLDVSNSATEALNGEVQPKVDEVTELQQNICSSYTRCQVDNSESAYDFFECSNEVSADAISSSYNIQTISKDRMQYIQLKQQIIKYDQDSCTTKCSNTYVEETAKVHTELQDCLAGKIPIATTEEPTTRTTTTDFPRPPTVDV